jgi:hypothetical protein
MRSWLPLIWSLCSIGERVCIILLAFQTGRKGDPLGSECNRRDAVRIVVVAVPRDAWPPLATGARDGIMTSKMISQIIASVLLLLSPAKAPDECWLRC